MSYYFGARVVVVDFVIFIDPFGPDIVLFFFYPFNIVQYCFISFVLSYLFYFMLSYLILSFYFQNACVMACTFAEPAQDEMLEQCCSPACCSLYIGESKKVLEVITGLVTAYLMHGLERANLRAYNNTIFPRY